MRRFAQQTKRHMNSIKIRHSSCKTMINETLQKKNTKFNLRLDLFCQANKFIHAFLHFPFVRDNLFDHSCRYCWCLVNYSCLLLYSDYAALRSFTLVYILLEKNLQFRIMCRKDITYTTRLQLQQSKSISVSVRLFVCQSVSSVSSVSSWTVSKMAKFMKLLQHLTAILLQFLPRCM